MAQVRNRSIVRRAVCVLAAIVLLLVSYILAWVANDIAFTRGYISLEAWSWMENTVFAPIHIYDGPGKESLDTFRMWLVMASFDDLEE